MTPPRFQILLGVSASWIPAPYRGRAQTWSVDPVAWRLLGSNNRECGRSATLFADADACVDALLVLRGTIGTLSTGLVATLGAGLWTWRVGTDAEPAAVSPRVYHRRREAQRSLEVATENILAARMPPDVVHLRRRTSAADRLAVRPIPARVIDLQEPVARLVPHEPTATPP